jgi:RNA-directed DNA polymerase
MHRNSTTVSTKQERIAGLAKQSPQMAFTSLAYLMDIDWLKEAYRRTRKDGAVGVDGVTAEDYERDLEGNLQRLLDRAKSGTYQAPPVRRVHIPKGGSATETRPLGIPTLEDKVLQRAVVMLLEPIYEQDFLDCSHGFRCGRSAHQALDSFRNQLMDCRGGWVLEVDIRKFFDTLDHGHLRTFLRLRVRDGVLLRLIDKWLKAGVMEDGSVSYPEAGAPQGGVASPLLSNVFLHYVLDLWFERRFKKSCGGYAELTRFADDFVAVFWNYGEAARFRREMDERLAAFGLRVAPEKTALLNFDASLLQGGTGRPAKKPDTFTFLGFTHFRARTRDGKIHIGRTPSIKSRERFLGKVAEWLWSNRHRSVWEHQAHLIKALNGFYQYFGLRLCLAKLSGVRQRAQKLWWRALRRRSQRGPRTTKWAKLYAKPWFQLPYPRLTQVWV